MFQWLQQLLPTPTDLSAGALPCYHRLDAFAGQPELVPAAATALP